MSDRTLRREDELAQLVGLLGKNFKDVNLLDKFGLKVNGLVLQNKGKYVVEVVV